MPILTFVFWVFNTAIDRLYKFINGIEGAKVINCACSIRGTISITTLKYLTMKRTLTLLLTASLLLVLGSPVFAQFDDLYADASDAPIAYQTDDSYAYDEYEEDYAYDSDYYDDYDEYADYRRFNYDIDAYTYTNRLDRYRLAYFTTAYYGQFASTYGGDAFYNDLAWRLSTDRGFRNYINRQMVFGPSYSSIFRRYGNYGNPYSNFWNAYGVNNGGFYGRGLSGFYGGFNTTGYNPYCPPNSYLGRTRNITQNSGDVRTRVINAPRTDGSTTRSKSVRTKPSSSRAKTTRSSNSTRVSDRSVRTTTRTRTNRSVRRATPNTSTRSTRTVRRSNPTRSVRTSSRATTRSSAPRATTRSTSTRSTTRSVRSSGSSSRSVRKNN